MKQEIDNKGKWKYYCDRCGKEISFKDKTMKQVHIKYSDRNSKKLCDLCDRCYRALERGIGKNNSKFKRENLERLISKIWNGKFRNG